MPFLASDRRRRCVLAVHIGRFYCSRHRAGRLFKSRRALCVRGSRSPSLAPGRRHCFALAVHIGRSYRSRHRARRSYKSRRSRCAHSYQCPLWRRTPPSLSSRRPHIGRISRRARCALTVLDALLNIGTPLSLSSRRPHRTLVPLLPSCRAIVQVETRSLCSRFSMPFFGVKPPPLLCSRRPHRTFIPLLPSRRVSRAGSSSRDTLFALRFSMPFFSVRPPPLLCSRRPHRTFYTALAIVQGDCSSRDALVVRSRYSMPCPTSDGTRHLRSALTSHRWRYSDGLLPS